MEQQFNNQPVPQQPSPKGIKPFWSIVLLVLVIVLVGVLVWQKNNASKIADSLQQQISSLQNQIIKLESKSYSPTGEIVATTSDETAEWKTYISSEMGFSVKYPQNLIVQENQTNVNFKFPNVIYKANHRATTFDFSFSINKDTQYSSITEFINETFPANDPNTLYHPTLITLDGVDFYYYGWLHQNEGEHYFTLRNGYLFEIQYTMNNFSAENPAFYNGIRATSQYDLFLEVLKTLKFTK